MFLENMMQAFYRVCTAIVVYQFCKKSYQGEFNEQYTNIAYTTIYIYSNVQIMGLRIYKHVYPFIKLTSTSVLTILKKYSVINETIVLNPIQFYKDGSLILKKMISSNFNELLEIEQDKKDYNFMIYTDCSNYPFNNVVYYHDIPEIFSYNVSNIKFLALALTFNNIEYDIKLHTTEHNYYIVNNIIDQSFLLYFMKNVLNLKINETSDFKYTLLLCDQNAEMKELNETDRLIIYKDSYEIKSKE